MCITSLYNIDLYNIDGYIHEYNLRHKRQGGGVSLFIKIQLVTQLEVI